MKNRLISYAILTFLTIPTAFPFDLKHGDTVLQVGGFVSTSGKAQHIDINGALGDDFSVHDRNDSNALLGLGYWLNGGESSLWHLSYGLNAFYLGKTQITGEITQESLFTNLAYRYNINHFPVFALAKASLNSQQNKNYSFSFDAGVGPNFLYTSHYHDYSLDGGMTLPDRAFSGKHETVFSATAGVTIKINQFSKVYPFECGYRFFYLGQSELRRNTDQLLNTLKTGHNYANALICSVTV